MKMFSVLFLSALLLTACKEDVPSANCDSTEPLNDISWLKDLKKDFDRDMSASKQRITKYNYQGTSVFMIERCVDCSDSMAILHNCEGTEICMFGGIGGVNTCPNFLDEATDKEILYDE